MTLKYLRILLHGDMGMLVTRSSINLGMGLMEFTCEAHLWKNLVIWFRHTIYYLEFVFDVEKVFGGVIILLR